MGHSSVLKRNELPSREKAWRNLTACFVCRGCLRKGRANVLSPGEELEDQAEVGRKRVTCCLTCTHYKFSLFGKTELNLKHGCSQLPGTVATLTEWGSQLSTGKADAESVLRPPQNPRRGPEGRPTWLCDRIRGHADQLAVLVSSRLQIKVDVACFIK